MNNRQTKKDSDDARRMLAVQPDFTADAACAPYQNAFGDRVGESVKSAKKGDWYRHESSKFIDYFAADESPVRYSLKTKRYDVFTGDAEHHLWFMKIESPALLARDSALEFEIVGKQTGNLEFNGKIEDRELIKIKTRGKTEIGGDLDKTIGFLYVAPELKNLVVKTELIFTKGGRTCTLHNISLAVNEEIFINFAAYRRRQADKFLTLPKPADVAKVEFDRLSIYNSLYFTEKSLLEALPRFVRGGDYKTKWIRYQSGTLTLTDGTILHWSANGADSLILQYEGQTRYYVLPPRK